MWKNLGVKKKHKFQHASWCSAASAAVAQELPAASGKIWAFASKSIWTHAAWPRLAHIWSMGINTVPPLWKNRRSYFITGFLKGFPWLFCTILFFSDQPQNVWEGFWNTIDYRACVGKKKVADCLFSKIVQIIKVQDLAADSEISPTAARMFSRNLTHYQLDTQRSGTWKKVTFCWGPKSPLRKKTMFRFY